MRSTDKISFDLFQKLRARYSPVTLGSESAEATSDPKEARFFNFIYKEQDQSLGPITISLIDNTSMKVFYGEDMVNNIAEKANWYNFLRELRGFAKRNLLTFDARDVSKSQLDSRDFKWLSDVHGKVDQKDITVSESAMFGSKRRSYQTLESVKLIVQHNKSVDESVPGARSRSIQGIYLERADGERYKFPYNYLTGARAMARHICEGGTPYDPIGQHVLSMIKEMRDLSKFARMTKTHALEDAQAGEVREQVVERYRGLKGVLSSLSNADAYKGFAESFKPADVDQLGDNLEELRERFTRRVWDTAIEELLPSVQRALWETEMLNLANQPAPVKEADQFASWANNVYEGLSDSNEVAEQIISMNNITPTSVDSVYQIVGDYVSQSGDQTINQDEVAQIIIDKFGLDESAVTEASIDVAEIVFQKLDDMNQVPDPTNMEQTKMVFYLAKQIGSPVTPEEVPRILKSAKKLFYRAAAADSEMGISADDQRDYREFSKMANEATTTGTIGTRGTVGTQGTAPDVPPGVDRAKLAQSAKNVTRLAQQGAGIKTNGGQMGKLVQAMVTGQPLPRGGSQTLLGLGNQLISNAMQDPRKANQLTAMLKRMRQDEDVSAEFDNWYETNIVNETNDLNSILKLAGLSESNS